MSTRLHGILLVLWPALSLACALPAGAADGKIDPPAWPIAFQETYVLAPEEGIQLPLEPSGMAVRRFYLRIESDFAIEIRVTRAYGSRVLFMERRASNVSTLVPWGRDERGNISLVNPIEFPVRVLLSIATDPAEEGEPVHRFYVNRFLEALEAGESDRLLGLLDRALAQDPQDSVAIRLVERVTGRRDALPDYLESRTVQEVEERIEELRREGDADAVDALVAAPPLLETETGIRRWNLVVGRVHMLRGQTHRALQSFYRALDHAPDVDARFEVYPLLVAANLAAGNAGQADAIVERARREAPDEAARARVEAWRSRGP